MTQLHNPSWCICYIQAIPVHNRSYLLLPCTGALLILMRFFSMRFLRVVCEATSPHGAHVAQLTCLLPQQCQQPRAHASELRPNACNPHDIQVSGLCWVCAATTFSGRMAARPGFHTRQQPQQTGNTIVDTDTVECVTRMKAARQAVEQGRQWSVRVMGGSALQVSNVLVTDCATRTINTEAFQRHCGAPHGSHAYGIFQTKPVPSIITLLYT